MTAKHIRPRLLIALAILALFAGVASWAFRNIGRWLVAPDNLQHAQAIVVLSRRVPFRAVEAANLYHQGWAPEVWLSRDEIDDIDETFIKLGVSHTSDQAYDQTILEKLGVPKEAIRILEPAPTNVVSEVTLIANELRRKRGDKIILVTSPLLTRRVKFIWHILVGDHPQAILRTASAEPADPYHWWRTTQDIQDVLHEVIGLVDVRLGFRAKLWR